MIVDDLVAATEGGVGDCLPSIFEIVVAETGSIFGLVHRVGENVLAGVIWVSEDRGVLVTQLCGGGSLPDVYCLGGSSFGYQDLEGQVFPHLIVDFFVVG